MSTSRILVSSGTEFEATVGYSRAVRVGPCVAVSGTTASGASDDIGAQTREALHRIDIALTEAGAALGDVIRTRIYVTDIARCARLRRCTPRYSATSAPRPPWWKWPR